MKILTPDPPHLNLEESLVHVADLLRCASATAYENGDSQEGSKRDLAFSVVHLVDLARAVIDRSLQQLEARPGIGE